MYIETYGISCSNANFYPRCVADSRSSVVSLERVQKDLVKNIDLSTFGELPDCIERTMVG